MFHFSGCLLRDADAALRSADTIKENADAIFGFLLNIRGKYWNSRLNNPVGSENGARSRFPQICSGIRLTDGAVTSMIDSSPINFFRFTLRLTTFCLYPSSEQSKSRCGLAPGNYRRRVKGVKGPANKMF